MKKKKKKNGKTSYTGEQKGKRFRECYVTYTYNESAKDVFSLLFCRCAGFSINNVHLPRFIHIP